MSIPTVMIFKNGEIVDKAVGVRTKEEYGSGHIKDALNIPYNETSNSRSIVAQISIDRCENGSPIIDLLNVDTHDWGEWITILSGVQEGN